MKMKTAYKIIADKTAAKGEIERKVKGQIMENVILWFTGGVIYYYLEIAYRGFSHYSMFICGGLCFLLVARTGEYVCEHIQNRPFSIILIMLLGGLIITSLEYLTGLLVNVKLGMDVWDYSEYRYNFEGQICLGYSLLWMLLSIVCVIVEKIIIKYIFRQNKKSL